MRDTPVVYGSTRARLTQAAAASRVAAKRALRRSGIQVPRDTLTAAAILRLCPRNRAGKVHLPRSS